MLNKKGQIGEQVEDIFSFLIVILLLAILFLIAIVFYKNGLTLQSGSVSERVINDKTGMMLNSIMREDQGNGLIFSDKIRTRDQDAKSEMDQKRVEVGTRIPGLYGFSMDSVYIDAVQECEKTPEDLTKTSCFFIPSEEPIAIKMTSIWGYKEQR